MIDTVGGEFFDNYLMRLKLENESGYIFRSYNVNKDLIDPEAYRDYDEFIMKCFNYFNGKVNDRLVEQCVILDKKDNSQDMKILGTNLFDHNIILINSYNLIRMYNLHLEHNFHPMDLKTHIVFLIVHELIHNDDDEGYMKGYKRKSLIVIKNEMFVDLATCEYIINNKDDIVKNLYNIHDDEIEKKYFDLYKRNINWKRPVKTREDVYVYGRK